MKKSDNKGFTLVEVIIAITILSAIIASGYKIIIGISIFINSQKNITSNMATANLVNKYLTKDIEKSKSISDIKIISNTSYKYTIVQEDATIEYIVENNNNKNKDTYNLTRKEDLSEILIVENQQRYDDFPFLINKTENNGVYEVIVNYKEDKKEKQYLLNASSRLTKYLEGDNDISDWEGRINIDDIPSIPPEVYLDTSYVGFCKSNKESNEIGKVGVWIDKNYIEGVSTNDISEISATIITGNNGSSEYAYIEDVRAKGIKNKILTENIMIYVIKGTKLENFSIYSKQGNTKIEVLDYNNKNIGNKDITLVGNDSEGVWYSCKSSREINIFEVNGRLSIDKTRVSSGFVLIVLGNQSK